MVNDKLIFTNGTLDGSRHTGMFKKSVINLDNFRRNILVDLWSVTTSVGERDDDFVNPVINEVWTIGILNRINVPHWDSNTAAVSVSSEAVYVNLLKKFTYLDVDSKHESHLTNTTSVVVNLELNNWQILA